MGATGRWQLRRAQNHAIAASNCSGSTEMYASAAVDASRSTAVAGSSVGRHVTLPSPLTFSVSGGVKSRPQLRRLQHHSYKSFMLPSFTSCPDIVAAAVQPSMASATSCHGSTTNLPTPVTFNSNRRSSASTQALFSQTASSTRRNWSSPRGLPALSAARPNSATALAGSTQGSTTNVPTPLTFAVSRSLWKRRRHGANTQSLSRIVVRFFSDSVTFCLRAVA
mmetsp:Transcript_21182/g.55326  ORF Transcript_21182/g.55326 Transcript_21182/m.55326 type:complete len:223 (+) Transcript_21182:351-1019(+)